MDLGSRQIRTAGKGSGSIELTLPTDLRDLVGLACRITLHDGSRPQIVLQPDLEQAQLAFAALWQTMAAALLPAAASRLNLAAFGFGLQPRDGGGEQQPFLCWRDGLALCRSPLHDAAALARTLTAFGHALAPSLGIAVPLAAGFGAACGYLATGMRPGSPWQEVSDMVAAGVCQQASRAAASPHALGPGTFGPGTIGPGAPLQAAWAAAADINGTCFWDVAGPLLSAAAVLFRGWTADPSDHTALRAALASRPSIELSGG